MNWPEFEGRLSDRQFRHMFRMSRDCFKHMCHRIESSIGEEKFKSEAFLELVKSEGRSTMRGQIYDIHKKYYGGLICGEIKLALTIRLMAGGSYLDLTALYVCGYTYVYQIFHYVNKNWICSDDFVRIDFYNNLTDENEMKKVSMAFANGTSMGLLYECIGAIDGWLVKIFCPNKTRDSVENPGGFFSRNGFFVLNVQVIVDKYKRVLWYSSNCKGGQHDSTAFKSTALYASLVERCAELLEKGWYIVGDSAYTLRTFLITPFDGTEHGRKEDNFNYFQSSCRIYVECAFGEIDNRWGIFWRPLKFSLDNNIQTIEVAFRLHNFIVNYDLDNGIRETVATDLFEEDGLEFLSANPHETVGAFGDNTNEERILGRGRINNDEKELCLEGVDFWDKLCARFDNKRMARPSRIWYRNQFNHTVMQ